MLWSFEYGEVNKKDCSGTLISLNDDLCQSPIDVNQSISISISILMLSKQLLKNFCYIQFIWQCTIYFPTFCFHFQFQLPTSNFRFQFPISTSNFQLPFPTFKIPHILSPNFFLHILPTDFQNSVHFATQFQKKKA